MAFNAILNIGFLASIPIEMSLSSLAAQATYSSTLVEMGAGIGPDGAGDFGGAVPAIALWNENGERIGQYHPPGGAKIEAGTSNKDPIVIKQDQGASGKPEYILVTTVDDDAICINYLTVSGNGVTWNWLGDIGYTCGADWFPSVAKFGSATYQPKCTWIDRNHSDNLRFIALSMHMPDFNGNTALHKEYNNNTDFLCNSRARFMQWGELPANPGENSEIPFFDPPLQYNVDGTDKDTSVLFSKGTVFNKRNDRPFSNSTSNADNSINRPGHVVISDHKAHSAQEVCDSATSRGPSFVSTHQGVYCDMSTKTSYPVCSSIITNKCFDIEGKQLVGQSRRHVKDLATREVHKQYKTHDRWTPSEE